MSLKTENEELTVIKVVMKHPKECALSVSEIDKIMEVFRIILKAFICDDYEVHIQTYKQEVLET